MTKFKLSILTVVVFSTPLTSWAWGRRGHQIVAETAAYLASEAPGGEGVKAHSFDLGYYANVPDLIWKRPATYGMEKPQHFMDLEEFDRAFAKKPEIKKPFELSRKEFEAQFPELKDDAGRSYWRIRELLGKLDKISAELRALPDPKGKARQDLQAKWILTAGILAHYVGDLGMPLHVTENHDGQLTGQKGLHSFFEDICVDELYPHLQDEVNTMAKKQWPQFKKKNAEKPVLEMLAGIAENSKKAIPSMLAIDKKVGREKPSQVCPKYNQLIVRRMVDSSLVLGEIYRRQLGWTFDNERFYSFVGEPEYMKPGEESAAPVPTKQ